MSWFYVDLSADSDHRYDMRRLIKFDDDAYDESTSFFLHSLRELSSVGTYTIAVEQRPDIYSRDIYGSTDYWQIILYYNDIVFLGELSVGTRLEYPSLSDMETLYFRLKSLSRLG